MLCSLSEFRNRIAQFEFQTDSKVVTSLHFVARWGKKKLKAGTLPRQLVYECVFQNENQNTSVIPPLRNVVGYSCATLNEQKVA